MTKQELINKTAKKVLKTLTKKDQKEILKFKPIELHYFLGAGIRNKYIYGHKEFDKYEPDDISQKIIVEMQKILKSK